MNISVTISDGKSLSINVGDKQVAVLRETNWFYKGKRLYINATNERDVESFNKHMQAQAARMYSY